MQTQTHHNMEGEPAQIIALWFKFVNRIGRGQPLTSIFLIKLKGDISPLELLITGKCHPILV